MRILISGSIAGHLPGTGQSPQESDAELLGAAEEIGYEAATRGHELLLRDIGSKNIVDGYCLKGADRFCMQDPESTAKVELHLPEFWELGADLSLFKVQTTVFRHPTHGGPAIRQYPKKYLEFLLALYAYYKQATVGDVQGKRPGMMDIKGRKKYDAWAGKRGLDESSAMKEYITVVQKLQAAD